MRQKNVTISLPEDVLKKLKIHAAMRETSISELLRKSATRIVNETESYDEAKRGMIADMANARDLGTKGRISWTRESLHDREALRR